MTETYEKCSCGSRQKSKCEKENGLGAGNMCIKPLPDFPEGYVFLERMKTFTPDDWVAEWERTNEAKNK